MDVRMKMKAIQFTGDNVSEIWDAFGTAGIYGPTETNPDYLIVTTINGSLHQVHPTDWVVPDWKTDTFVPISNSHFRELFTSDKSYPEIQGDYLVLGPECFTRRDDLSVISYKGQNYYLACDMIVARDLVSRAATHCVKPRRHSSDHEDHTGRVVPYRAIV